MKITLKAARVNAGIKQMDVAKMLGVSPSAVSLWEDNKRNCTARQFMKLCELYGIDPHDIFLPAVTP